MSEIDTYQPGRELDALIAKEVFGKDVVGNAEPGFWITVGNLKKDGFEKSRWRHLTHYSTGESDAFEIVKYLCQAGREPNKLYFKLVYGWWFKADREKKGYPLARAVFDWKETGDSNSLYQAVAGTIPLAICRAALRVVREAQIFPEVE
jgi:hypothetical protein